MKRYYPETDSLYVEFKSTPGAETVEITDGLNIDLDADGGVVRSDIGHASKRLVVGLRNSGVVCAGSGVPGEAR